MADHTAQRRLLDLLSGWSGHVAMCSMSDVPHPGVTRDEYRAEATWIADLYQEVGQPVDLVDVQHDEFMRRIDHFIRFGYG